MKIAYCITAHGFGHAARACGVIEALWRLDPGTQIEILTTAPPWFFAQSLSRPVVVHDVTIDLGVVQTSSLQEDLDETLRSLRAWVPFPPDKIEPVERIIAESGCDLVICDIAPIGLEVARRNGLPSVLIENFTWDWIYRGYRAQKPELEPIAEILGQTFASASLRIRTQPFCGAVAGSAEVGPISRAPRMDPRATRRLLGVPPEALMVMATMGGIEWDYAGIEERLDQRAARRGAECWLVVPGASQTLRRLHRAVLLPHRSDFYHPDLVLAADAVIGKLGYSTVAEIYRAGVPFGYVPRPRFPESPPLEAWVRDHLPHRRIAPEAFVSWAWLDDIEALLDLPRQAPATLDGATTAAALITEIHSTGRSGHVAS